jgi:hypothetical protein
MKKRCVFILVLAGFLLRANAQISGSQSNLASIDVHLPVGVFARSHTAGAGLNYSWSAKRFGRNTQKKKPGLVLNAGGDYYLGKKIKVTGHDFRYDAYFYAHAMAGILFNPWSNANISLSAGPTLGIYSGNSDFGYGVSLLGAYFFKRNISIGPGIIYKKHSKADALWSGAARVSYGF